MHSQSESQKKNLDKWQSVLGTTTSNDKLNWMTEYAEHHKLYDSAISSLSSLQTKEEFPSLLPIAMKVAAKTIGQDLVSVNPIGGGDLKLLEAAKSKVKATNRERQMDSVLEDKPFEPLKIEDTEEYKEYSKYSGPKMDLMYLDYQYNSPSTVENKPKKNHRIKTKKK
jgi:hypothetical protein